MVQVNGELQGIPLKGHHPFKGNSPEAVKQFLSDMRLYNGGTVVLPQYKLAFCSIPKAGCTTTKWMGAHLATNQSQYSICKSNNISPLLNNNRIDRASIPEIFMSPNWTSVGFIRDPWTRAISAYEDQVKRRHVPYVIGSRNDFLKFTERNEGWGKHTGHLVDHCGHSHVRYDHYVDIEHLSSDLRAALRGKPEVLARLETGWERCTRNKSPSLIDSESDSGHTAHASTEESLRDKIIRLDRTYCNETTAKAVAVRYKADYKFIEKAGFRSYESPHICLN